MTTLSGAVVLRWRNRNIKDIDGTNIYRSVNTPLDINNLPAPYDFQEGNQEYYVDYPQDEYYEYYYAIGVIDKGEEKITGTVVTVVAGGEPLLPPIDIESEYIEFKAPDNIESEYLTN